jgi:hypothetical protein
LLIPSNGELQSKTEAFAISDVFLEIGRFGIGPGTALPLNLA